MATTPLQGLPPVITQSLRRYLGYGWGDALILALVKRRHGVKLSHVCVDNLREGKDCTARCREHCVLKVLAPGGAIRYNQGEQHDKEMLS